MEPKKTTPISKPEGEPYLIPTEVRMTGRRKSSSKGQTVILIADDEVLIRSVARIVLAKQGYFTLACQDGEEALHVSRKFPGTIHAVLSDVRMPKVNGLELREQILAERPDIKILLMSGETDSTLPANVAFCQSRSVQPSSKTECASY